jgi:hypothetical protein
MLIILSPFHGQGVSNWSIACFQFRHIFGRHTAPPYELLIVRAISNLGGLRATYDDCDHEDESPTHAWRLVFDIGERVRVAGRAGGL